MAPFFRSGIRGIHRAGDDLILGTISFTGFPFLAELSAALPSPVPGGGLSMWFDAAQGLTLDGATSRVTSWTPRGGTTGAAGQGTTASMPIVATMNGLPSVSFDGVDDYLSIADAVTVGDDSTLFLAFQVGTATTFREILSGPTPALGFGLINDGKARLWNQGGSDIVYSAAALPTGSAIQICTTLARNGGTSGMASLRVNRVASATTGPSVAAFGNPTNAIGRYTSGGNYLPGLISEILLYARVLSSAEIAQVEDYLAAKWGTA